MVNRFVFGVLLVIVLAAITAEVGVARYEFLFWDDNRIVQELQFRSETFGGFIGWLANTNVTLLFTPISLLFFGSLAEVFGLTPMTFHVAGVFLHLLNMVLVYILILKLFSIFPLKSSLSIFQPLVAATAAGVWGMHALRAEVIAWVAAMPYALSTTFALLSVLSFVSSFKPSIHRIGYWLSFIFFCLSILAYPQSVPLSFVLIALDFLICSQECLISKSKKSIIYLLGRHAPFILIGALVVFIGMVVRSSQPNMPFQLTMGSLDSILLNTNKLIGFTIDFALFHTWFPNQISNIYIGYEKTGLLSRPLILGIIFFLFMIWLGLRNWASEKKGLLLSIVCHVAFCIPAAGLFMPQYLLADRYVYGLAIIASIVFAFAFREFGEYLIKRFSTVVPISAVVVSFSSVAIALLFIFSFELFGALQNWKNTHTLMVHLQETGPSQGWRYFAKLRDMDYWRTKGDVKQMQLTLLGFADASKENSAESLANAVEYLVMNSRCNEARYLVRSVEAKSILLNSPKLNALFKLCR